MKKGTIKAFTLVEMLIVIVIIGILIASLMPRMQSAQWRARDVARKNDLAQIQTAIITSQQDRGVWPGGDDALWWITVNTIEESLKTAWMTQVPWDPNQSNAVYWLWAQTTRWTWQYIYMVSTRNSVKKAWFALMAKTEVEWWSNWVTCSWWYNATEATALAKWWIISWADLKNVTTCTSLTQNDTATECGIHDWTCIYTDIAELRYLLVY